MATQPLVAWTIPDPRPAAPTTDVQVYAIAIGASVPAVVACVAYWLDVEYVAIVAGFGTLIGPVLAVEGAGRMVDSWWAGALRAAFIAPLIAAGVIVGSALLGAAPGVGTFGPEAIVGAVGVTLFVAAFALLLGMPVTIPTALVVAWLVRRAAGMDRRRARLHVGALTAAAAIGAAITLVAAQGSAGGLLSGAWIG
jgi:hypothetical protein